MDNIYLIPRKDLQDKFHWIYWYAANLYIETVGYVDKNKEWFLKYKKI